MTARSALSIVPVMVVFGRADRAQLGSALPQAGTRAVSAGAHEVMLPSASLPTDGVVVVGFGRASVGPEMVTVSFGTECCGTEPASVMCEAATKTGWAVDAVRGLGVPDENIRARGCSLWAEPIKDPETGGPSGKVTYHVSKQIEVSLHDPDQLTRLVRAMTGAGVFSITGVNFNAKDIESLIRFQSLLMSLEGE